MLYSLGLDIGITSVGWSVLDLDNKRIEALGVRLFPGAENPKDGSSLAAPRREARSTRRRLRRKRQRLSDIRKLIISSGILTQKQLDEIFSIPSTYTPWELRAQGLDRVLSPAEWSRVLFHIAKHRGFKSNRTISQDEKSAKATEDGKAKEGMKSNSALLVNGNEGKGYRTVGEMVENDQKFAAHKRNKSGDYSNTITRSDLENEIKILFDSQRGFGNKFALLQIEEKYLEIFSRQLPFASGEILERMTGFCTLEPTCKRAPKAAWTSERFVLLSKILNLRVRVNGRKIELGIDQQRIIADLAYKNAKVTYKQIRNAFDADDDWYFENIPISKKAGNPEDAVFIELKAFHLFRKTITKALGDDYWNTLINTTPVVLDVLAFALTFRKTDDEIKEYLKVKHIDENLIKAVMPLNFSEVLNLSLEAMTKLIPFMENGDRYDQACEKAGYCHYNPLAETERSLKLQLPDQDEIRNPVVYRAIAQTRKVVNAIVKKYGSPRNVQIELARDLSKSKEERNKIEKEQSDSRNQKSRLSEEFEENFKHRPNGAELEKYRLWKEQGGYCPYSGVYIDPKIAFESNDGNYAEIDHIIPYSRCFDDSLTNKVLVIGSENRNKKEHTPYEYFGESGDEWDRFVANVDMYVTNRKRAERLKRRDFDDKDGQEMKDRNLGDTRWITKFVAGWIERNLLFADPENKKPVNCINGRATATLRRQWGVNALKNRQGSDLHHALDACVIAAATPSMIKAISDYSRKREMCLLREESPENKKSRFTEPWPHFRKEIEARLADDPAAKISEFGLTNYSAEELARLKPIFVSRKPDRKTHGASHQETIRSAKYIEDGKTAVRTKLLSIKLADLENMVGKERDTVLYNALKTRLMEFGDDPKKAFKEEFRKPTKDGSPGPVVRSIKLLSPGISGVSICNGIASNGGMVRVDVYVKKGKYYLIPYYVDDLAKGLIKNKAIIAYKDEASWENIDSNYSFVFSLYKNDLIRIIDNKGKEIIGYYLSCHRGTGAIEVLHQAGGCSWSGIGVKTAKLFEKYNVDVLGNYYKVKREKPLHELA